MNTILKTTVLLFAIAFTTSQTIAFSNSNDISPLIKVLIVVTSHEKMGNTDKKTGYYLSEVTHPYFKFSEAGFAIDIASPKGGKSPMDKSSHDLKDKDNKRFLEDKKLMALIENTIPLNKVNPDDYSAIFFAGGHGTMWDFPSNKIINDITASIYEKGGVVAAVCHGPAALVDVKLSNNKYLIEGKSVTSFTNAEESAVKLTKTMPFPLESKLVERGATFNGAKMWQNNVVVSERIVTGQNPASASSVGKAVVKLLTKKKSK
jgi:putative intracellular protease/amidase